MLRNKADYRTLAFIATYIVLVAFQWFCEIGNPLLQGVLIFLTCIVSWLAAVIAHNTLHCPIFVKRIYNRIFQVVLTMSYGFPVSEYIPGHNLSHHRYTQTRKDVMRTTKVQFKSNWVNFLAFVPRVALDVTRANFKYVKAMKKRRPIWFRQLLIEMSFCWGSKVLFLLLDWRKALLYIVIPHLFALWAITAVNYLQHDGCDSDSPYNHSRNFVGKSFNWFMFNNGYHGIHHVQPGLHWSVLPEAHAKRIHPHIDPALEQSSFFLYLFRCLFSPGERLRFDGQPFILPLEGEDENWMGT